MGEHEVVHPLALHYLPDVLYTVKYGDNMSLLDSIFGLIQNRM